jgi:hypothetical protein
MRNTFSLPWKNSRLLNLHPLHLHSVSSVYVKLVFIIVNNTYESKSRSFRIASLERELQIVQLSATRCSCIAILWVSLVSFAATTLYVASQREYIIIIIIIIIIILFISLSTQSGNFWIHPRTCTQRMTFEERVAFEKQRVSVHCHQHNQNFYPSTTVQVCSNVTSFWKIFQ